MREKSSTSCKRVPLPFSVFLCVLCALCAANAQEFNSRPADELRKLPIVVGDGELVKLLKTRGRKARPRAMSAIAYDNRDGDHSPLDIRAAGRNCKKFITPTQMLGRPRQLGRATRALPIVVFGNSSTSAAGHSRRGQSSPVLCGRSGGPLPSLDRAVSEGEEQPLHLSRAILRPRSGPKWTRTPRRGRLRRFPSDQHSLSHYFPRIVRFRSTVHASRFPRVVGVPTRGQSQACGKRNVDADRFR